MSLRMQLREAQAIQQKLTGKKPDKPAKRSKRSKLEQDLAAQFVRLDLPEWREEYKFHSVREWRFDFAWPDLRFAVEVDGLVRDGKGGHQTMEGVTGDCQKHAEALLWGWQVYRCTQAMVKSGEAAETVLRLLTRREVEMATEGRSYGR